MSHTVAFGMAWGFLGAVCFIALFAWCVGLL